MPPPSPLTNSAIAETLGLPSQASSSAMIALYSAALGPVQLPRYLALFERFDRASRDGRIERAPLGWNLAASVLTLDWMALHSLWKAALVYGALVYGLALVVLGVAQPLLNMPPSVEYGLLGALALFSIALPGLLGDALLHAEIRQRIGRAIAAEPNLPGACAILEKQASSQPRMVKIAAVHGLVLALLALALFMFLPNRSSRSQATASPSGDTSQVLPSKKALAAPTDPAALPGLLRPAAVREPLAEPPAPQEAAVPEAPAAALAPPLPVPVPAPTPAPASAPLPAAALAPAPAPPPPPAPAKAEKKAAGRAEQAVENPVDKAAAQAAAKAAARAAAKAAKTPTLTKKAADKASAKLRKKTTAVAPDPAPAPAKKVPTAATSTPVVTPATPAVTPAASNAALPLVGTAAGHYLNVGAFGEVGNARRAQAKLLNAGFPAFRQTAASPKGDVIRVRVGPYSSAAEAQKAAQQIRRMGLEAVAFRQRGQ